MSAWKYQQNNELPVSWESTPLNYLFTIIGGNGFAPELQGESDGELPFIKNSDIRSGISKISAAVNYVSRDLAQKEGFNIVPENSILMGKIGESMKKNRRVLNTVECCIDNNMQAMVPHMELIQPEYGLYALQLLDAADFNNGGPVPSINNIKWKRAHIPLPRKREQIRIMAVLDSETAKIDRAIELLQQELDTLEQLKKSVIHEAVTKGLDPTVPMKPSGVDWIGDIPEHWEANRLKFVLNNFDYLRMPIEASERSTQGDALYPYYGASGVIDHIDSFNVEGDSILVSEDGANLVSRSLPIAYHASGRYWVNNHAHILRPKAGSIRYYFYALEACDYAPYITGSAQPKLSQTNLNNVYLPVPSSRAEQERIAENLQRVTNKFSIVFDSKREQLELLRQQRQSLIFEYVTGKRRVSEVA